MVSTSRASTPDACVIWLSAALHRASKTLGMSAYIDATCGCISFICVLHLLQLLQLRVDWIVYSILPLMCHRSATPRLDQHQRARLQVLVAKHGQDWHRIGAELDLAPHQVSTAVVPCTYLLAHIWQFAPHVHHCDRIDGPYHLKCRRYMHSLRHERRCTIRI